MAVIRQRKNESVAKTSSSTLLTGVLGATSSFSSASSFGGVSSESMSASSFGESMDSSSEVFAPAAANRRVQSAQQASKATQTIPAPEAQDIATTRKGIQAIHGKSHELQNEGKALSNLEQVVRQHCGPQPITTTIPAAAEQKIIYLQPTSVQAQGTVDVAVENEVTVEAQVAAPKTQTVTVPFTTVAAPAQVATQQVTPVTVAPVAVTTPVAETATVSAIPVMLVQQQQQQQQPQVVYLTQTQTPTPAPTPVVNQEQVVIQLESVQVPVAQVQIPVEQVQIPVEQVQIPVEQVQVQAPVAQMYVQLAPTEAAVEVVESQKVASSTTTTQPQQHYVLSQPAQQYVFAAVAPNLVTSFKPTPRATLCDALMTYLDHAKEAKGTKVDQLKKELQALREKDSVAFDNAMTDLVFLNKGADLSVLFNDSGAVAQDGMDRLIEGNLDVDYSANTLEKVARFRSHVQGVVEKKQAPAAAVQQTSNGVAVPREVVDAFIHYQQEQKQGRRSTNWLDVSSSD